jgi:hypothetical protein
VLPADLSGARLLRLAEERPDEVRALLRALGAEGQARACQDLRPELRPRFLMLVDEPEAVVPLLPDAEVCITIRATGMSEAAWLLEIATPEQRQACFDLDCWQGEELAIERAIEWIDALTEAGRETLAQAFGEVDPELLVLALRTLTGVAILGKEEVPPPDSFTVDGVVYFTPRDGAAAASVHQLAVALYENAPERYWQLVYGVVFESPSECVEYALRWRTGRLADLGFPEYEWAMRVYQPLRPEDAPIWEAPDGGHLVASQSLPRTLEGSLLAQALAALPPARASDVLSYVLAVANAIAVADRMLLSDSDSIPKAVAKAARGIDLGLRELARQRSQPASEVLDRTQPFDLFRVGATSDPSIRKL